MIQSLKGMGIAVLKEENVTVNDTVRLNKYLSDAGICSRREADRLIEAGKVKVDGRVALMGERVSDKQIITVDGKKVSKEEELILLAVNKPVGVVCTTSDKDRAQNIVEFINYPKRIYPIGRLDKDSQGLILMTNKGDIADKILRGSNFHEKEYIVEVDKPINKEFISKMEAGVPILDTVTRPCKLSKTGPKSFKIIITQGLNRQIRRMCEYFGFKVMKLKRLRILNIELGNLELGKWRVVTKEEEKELFRRIGYKG
ncbi:MAG: pseudouridine synthase [Lachnospiraceae bacterium]|nr:pseudouridine synthase [Lachnospiraceae bacterium]